ncbi:diacylglycerol/lipid kinase family protein [Novosphingobium album (ex Liu et al. 2023)]|uniref:Diacylglycerol kinase family protein n=1 Tax=Novosphingobium album (ex Liu et al. 2023) TaxID=3031130 RepID=A0ABT5WQL7_9SPHN|nr:diacylglycerol kinase family protein [Novosphingobium album (ex Liu et al. 2023)]MDE8651582.1 diacylglycerol kinase family protein [Novosphingobium album (ex Liu et al. 2023)]
MTSALAAKGEPLASAPLAVIVNRGGGTAAKLGDKLEEQVRAAFAATGRPIDLHCVEGRDIPQAVARARGGTVAVGGGDGTLSCAAGVLARQQRRLAVLPLGTLNHFAHAIGLDGTLEQAARVAAGDHARRIDLGCAGDRLFINNASIGIYARMVRDRDRRALPKWLATIPAALGVLARPGARHVRLMIDGETRFIKTPLLFVGNNRYSLATGRLGERAELRDGLLSLYAVAERGSLGLIVTAIRVLAGKADPQADFAALADAREVVVAGHGEHQVAIDGEVHQMPFPLRFAIRPAALAVMVPAGESTGASE